MPETPVKSDDQRPSNGVPFKVDLALGDELALQGTSHKFISLCKIFSERKNKVIIVIIMIIKMQVHCN